MNRARENMNPWWDYDNSYCETVIETNGLVGVIAVTSMKPPKEVNVAGFEGMVFPTAYIGFQVDEDTKILASEDYDSSLLPCAVNGGFTFAGSLEPRWKDKQGRDFFFFWMGLWTLQ